MIGGSGLHARRNAKGTMNAAEIVIREIQRDGSLQVRQFLAERIGQQRKTSHCHAHGQVLPFHKTGRDVLGIGIAKTNLGYDLHDAWWGVPRIRTVELAVIAKQVCQLRKVSIQPEELRNTPPVVVQPIGGDLNTASDAVIKVAKERSGILAIALANVDQGTSLASASSATNTRWSPNSGESVLRTRRFFLATNVQISSICMRRQ